VFQVCSSMGMAISLGVSHGANSRRLPARPQPPHGSYE
jgi:hypothetical protein